MDNKKDIFRKNAKSIRSNIDISECSKTLTEHIFSWEVYQNARNVMIFYPIGSEYSLLSLMNDKNKSFLFPSVCSDKMFPVVYNELNGFETGEFGIKEPVGEKLSDYNSLDLIFLPALAADLNGYRLGYGKGYYDRFLEHVSSSCIKVVPISSKLLFDKIPFEPHDKQVDYLITENGIIKSQNFISNC